MDKKLSSVEKVAALMLSLGDEIASSILRTMKPNEVKAIAAAMSRLKAVTQETVDEVTKEFYDHLSKTPQNVSGGKEVAKSFLEKTLPKSQSSALISSLRETSLTEVNNLDVNSILGMLKNEHPQTIALALAQLDLKKAGLVLKLFPPLQQTEIIKRMAQLDTVSSQMLSEMQEVLTKQAKQIKSGLNKKLGGPEQLAKLLSSLDPTTSQKLLADLAERDQNVAQKVTENLFVFQDLSKFADRDLQTILQVVPYEDWVIALRGVDRRLLAALSRNMSTRTAQRLKDDLEQSPKLSLQDVVKKQRAILTQVKQLLDDGKVELEP